MGKQRWVDSDGGREEVGQRWHAGMGCRNGEAEMGKQRCRTGMGKHMGKQRWGDRDEGTEMEKER